MPSLKRKDNPNWKGGVHINIHGRKILIPGHPKADGKGYVSEYILVVEKATGKIFPRKNPIHHLDGNNLNNSKNNLIVCESQAYHLLLHQRKRAYESCGKAGSGSV